MITETFPSKDGHHWRVRTDSGAIVAESRRGYSRPRDAIRAFDRLLYVIGGEVLKCTPLPPASVAVANPSRARH